jgi:serum/glucocorticoid-regulated kinase 2
LQRNPEKRLGNCGIQEIKHHPWLADVDWKGLREKTYSSPFIPLSIEENYEDYK